ncbi:MAG: peptidase MA family metallohydrolase [Candidatus Zixiibacteriota bacterium]
MCLLPVVAQGQTYIRADIARDSIYVDSVIEVTHRRLIRMIGFFPEDSLDVYIVNSKEQFDSLAGPYIPDWGAAVAIAHKNRIVIKSPRILPGDKSLGELAAHEYTHIALARKVGYRPIPRWFNEGMAQYLSAEWDWQDNVAMGTAILLGYTLDLSEMELLNSFTSGRAETAYAESYLAFRYFLENYGDSGVRIFLESCRRKNTFNQGMILATGAGYGTFEREFKIYLNGRYNLLAVIFNSNIIWLILALIIIIGFILTRIRRKSRMQELDEYDSLHSTDFDYGEVEKPDEDKPWD